MFLLRHLGLGESSGSHVTGAQPAGLRRRQSSGLHLSVFASPAAGAEAPAAGGASGRRLVSAQGWGGLRLEGREGREEASEAQLDDASDAVVNQFHEAFMEEEPARKPVSADCFAALKREPGFGLGACAICLDDFGKQETVVRLPCGHPFHEGCSARWFLEQHTCPVCRHELAEQSAEEAARAKREHAAAAAHNDMLGAAAAAAAGCPGCPSSFFDVVALGLQQRLASESEERAGRREQQRPRRARFVHVATRPHGPHGQHLDVLLHSLLHQLDSLLAHPEALRTLATVVVETTPLSPGDESSLRGFLDEMGVDHAASASPQDLLRLAVNAAYLQ